ncbi:hypothetical protein PHMEG_00038138 [Phytophthora megakarya]|uniref:ZSWIM1/3 RNaseH-like domain-containing protein n=1 Tax=Phytophthora megakarya TaxID=4795 RepID=A0A225UI44_9STRA|nr:hypothetical protein PHMEG_00038138 [Phytophthora megakarya]
METVLQEFSDQEDVNTARIFVDEECSVAVAVGFQTAGIKRLFAAFPEVLLVATTYDTNENACMLFSLVVHDRFGKYVQQALVERETQENLRLVLDVFKQNNPEYGDVKVIMTNKAFHEKVRCANQVAKLVRGNKEVRTMIEAIMAQLIDPRSATEYEDQKELLLDLLGGEDETRCT